MNKLVKGSIAGAVGIALLLGGGATLASWNDSVDNVGGGAITAGTLDIAANSTAGVWTDQNDEEITLNTYKIVPGDALTYTAKFDVTASGDNLKASATITPGSIAAASESVPADVELAKRLVASATYTVDTVDGATAVIDQDTDEVVVTVTVTWASNAADNDAKLGNVNLSNFAVALSQTV